MRLMTLAPRVVLAACFVVPLRASAAPAERIIRGGPIVTVNPAQPTAQAVAIAGGRIVAVGGEADVMRHAGAATEVTDLGGKTLVPGFVDGHSHFMSLVDVRTQALCASPPAGPCTTVADVTAALKGVQERRKLGPGRFVMGFGYDPELLAERRAPTRQELDAAFPENPVILVHVSGHGAMLNSRALAAYGITAATPTPPGGVIGREPGSNEPNGLLFETAFLPIFAKVPGPDDDETLELLKAGQELYLRAGITTAQEGATMKHQLDLLRILADRGDLKIDVVALPFITEIDAPQRAGVPEPAADRRGEARERRLAAGKNRRLHHALPDAGTGGPAGVAGRTLVSTAADQRVGEEGLRRRRHAVRPLQRRRRDRRPARGPPLRLGRRPRPAAGHRGRPLAVHPP
jgi:hypothetical protein